MMKRCITPKPDSLQLEWMSREKSVFFHFGINTFTGKEWGDGTENPKEFNPTDLDCRQWIRTIKKAGFTAAILTAKHHDGFCLWPTKYTDFSIKNSSYKNGNGDVVREFVDACNEYGIKSGIYVSPWDRHSDVWNTPAYNDYFVNQLHELLTNYGKIYEIWWDGAGSANATYDFERWVFTVRSLQPECFIYAGGKGLKYSDGRWAGNEQGTVSENCWATLNSEEVYSGSVKNLSTGDKDGDLFKSAEADVSCRPGWFYHDYQDKYSKTAEQILYIWFNSCGKNASMLFNIPPDKTGRICDTDVKNLTGFGNILKRTFEVNLLGNAYVSVAQGTESVTSAENILLDNKDNLYAAMTDDWCEISFKTEEPFKTDCFTLSENPKAGYTIRSYEIYAKVNGELKKISEGESVGYRRAEYFDEIETDEILLRVKPKKREFYITQFGMYKLDKKPISSKTVYEDSGNMTENSDVSINDNEITINLGGIFPYNTIIMDGTGIEEYEIHTFNGAIWDYEATIKNPAPKEETRIRNITWSYQLKIIITKGKWNGNAPEVYYRKTK